MNRINPLYIALFLLFILALVIYQDHKIAKMVDQEQQRLHQIQDVAKKITTLKNYWGDKKIQRQRVLSLVNSPIIKPFIKTSQQNRDRYKLFLHNIDAKNADRIADKIFNSFVRIGSFKIDRQNRGKISMEVEFRY